MNERLMVLQPIGWITTLREGYTVENKADLAHLLRGEVCAL